MVALDIDGTLLDPAGHIAPRTALAIQEALDRGIHVILCTGRTFSRDIRRLATELNLSLPAIVRNGSAVQDCRTGAVLVHRPLPPAAVRAAVDAIGRASECDVAPSAVSPLVEEGPQHEESLYSLARERCHAALFHYLVEWGRTIHLRHVPVLEDLYLVRDSGWIGACGEGEAVRAVYESLRHLEGVSVSWTGELRPGETYHCASITPAGCTKASALAAYAAEHGVAMEQVLAVGDYLNDMEMLAEAGWGVAMGHAPDSVKAVAKVVVPDNAHDGAAIAIERYVFGRQ